MFVFINHTLRCGDDQMRHCHDTHPDACLSSSICTGMFSWPRKRLIIGRLLANLSLISITKTSVIRATKVCFYMEKQRENWKKNTSWSELFQQMFVWLWMCLFLLQSALDVYVCVCVCHLSMPHRISSVSCNAGSSLLAMMGKGRKATSLAWMNAHLQIRVWVKKHPLLQPHCTDIWNKQQSN